MMKRLSGLLFLLSLGLNVRPEATFMNLNLSEKDYLLFSALVDSPRFGEYTTLFGADLKTFTMSQYSYFPEEVTLLDGNTRMQIRNRFGVFRTDQELESIAHVAKFPSFLEGDQIQTGKINRVDSSPDGDYLIYLQPTSTAYGTLILFDVKTKKEITVTANVPLSYDKPAAIWSPDSEYFIYARDGQLYYYSIGQFQGNRLLQESYRRIGDGRLDNVSWSKKGSLYYVRGSLVYRIQPSEFFTRSLYADLLDIGEIIGKIPFEFDPVFDNFSMSPDGRIILLNKGGRNLFLYYLIPEDFKTVGDTKSLPYLFLPRNTRVLRTIWSNENIVTILAGSIVNGETQTQIFRIDLRGSSKVYYFQQTTDQGVLDIIANGDETMAALLFKDKVVIKQYSTWTDKATYTHPDPLHLLWRSSIEIVVAGRYCTEAIRLDDSTRKLICFSQIDAFGFQDPGGAIILSSQNTPYALLNGVWVKQDTYSVNKTAIASSSFRVYLENLFSGSYRSMVMVRNVSGFGTKPLFNYPNQAYDPFPQVEQDVGFDNFEHGSRIRRREISLVFNAIDDVTGLTEILRTLSDYNIQCTFFINGNFIKRHPDAVKEIADSGHEVGSLFSIYFNMTDARFIVDGDFIKRGLAKNEDDYFLATGKELSLIWHAPYYVVTNSIIAASYEMGYTYIGRDVDPLDWTSGKGSVADMIERIMKLKQPGSIIPVRVGQVDTGSGYLFKSLDVLINGLLSQGYEIATVSKLVEHAR